MTQQDFLAPGFEETPIPIDPRTPRQIVVAPEPTPGKQPPAQQEEDEGFRTVAEVLKAVRAGMGIVEARRAIREIQRAGGISVADTANRIESLLLGAAGANRYYAEGGSFEEEGRAAEEEQARQDEAGGGGGPVMPQGPKGEGGFRTRAEREDFLGQFPEGQRTLFGEFLTSQFPDINPFGRTLAGRQFDPARAIFQMKSALQPSDFEQAGLLGEGQPQTFADFLRGAPRGLNFRDPSQFQNLLQGLGGAFGAKDPTVAQAATMDPFSVPAGGGVQGPARNVITQAFASTLSPYMRQFAPRVLEPFFQRFAQQSAGGNLMEAFLGGKLGQGQGFFGGF